MAERAQVLKRYSYPLCLLALFATAFVLRVYRLGELPDVLHVDEAGIGYNAWCLANYGVDRYLNDWPIYPQNYYYSGQSPLYTYSLVLLLKLFPVSGLTTGLVRIPALLSSMLAVICTPRMFERLFGSRKAALAGTALITFCPYFIMAGRYALDCNMMLGTGILSITLLLRYLQKSTWPALLLCGGGFALVLYTYAVSYLVLPVFLVAISLYMLYTKKVNLGGLLVLAGELCVLGLPIILFVICLVFNLQGFHFLGLHILPIASERMGDLAWTGFAFDVLNNIKVTLTHDFHIIDAVEQYYTMYVISIGFIAAGFVWALTDFVRSLWSRSFTVNAVFLFFAGAVEFAMGLVGSGSIYRSNAIFMCYLYFCVAGIRQVLHFMRRYRKAFEIAVCASYAFWTAAFLRYYFTEYSVADSYTYPNSYYFVPEREALARVMEERDAKAVYIDSFFEEYYYFYYLCSPYEKENADPLGTERKFYGNVDENTPIEKDSAYMVRKENSDFIENLQNAGVSWEMEEYKYYYVFTLP